MFAFLRSKQPDFDSMSPEELEAWRYKFVTRIEADLERLENRSVYALDNCALAAAIGGPANCPAMPTANKLRVSGETFCALPCNP